MKSLVFGGSLKPERYSYKALQMLQEHKIPTVSYGLREGKVGQVAIDNQLIEYENLHTITLYVNAKRQEEYYDYFLSLKPKRVIFNPGTENQELERLLNKDGIETLRACTLVMLSTGQY